MSAVVPAWLEGSLANSQDISEIILPFTLTAGTGVNSAAFVGADKPRLLIEGGTGSALTTITQSSVDALLGSVNEVVVATAFGTSAMVDNDTYAFVLDCRGQIADVLTVDTRIIIGSTVSASAGFGTKTAFTNASFTLTQIYVTALGNIAGRITFTNISAAASAGLLQFRILAKIK